MRVKIHSVNINLNIISLLGVVINVCVYALNIHGYKYNICCIIYACEESSQTKTNAPGEHLTNS